jgi:S-adenosylmethionine hydrolase
LPVSVTRPIVFLSDYGLEDEFVGTCHGVIAGVAPESRIIDLTHAIPPHDVLRGALVLAQAVRFMPADAVFLAVVDPGVGTARWRLAVRTESGSHLVGPDNGVLSLAWARLGGVAQAVEIASPDVVLQPIAPTFHGRDVFAPAAAHLARGSDLASLGPPLDPGSLVILSLPQAEVRRGRVSTEVLAQDRFGNLQLSARPSDLEAAGLSSARVLEVRGLGVVASLHVVASFGEVEHGDLALIVDSGGWLAIAVNEGSAAEALGLSSGAALTVAEPGG